MAVGDDSGLKTVAAVFEAFLPKINEIQAAGDAAAQAEVDRIVMEAGGGTAPPVTKTATGSTSPSGVTAGDFLVVGNVCKPRNFPALAAAKELQLQLNRVGRARGLGTISVDGDIGPGTVGMLLKVSPSAAVSSCAAVTSQLPALTSAVRSMADGMGAPPPSSQDLAKASSAGSISVPTQAGNVIKFKPPGAKASLLDTFHAMPDTTKLIAIGAVGLGGVFLIKKLRGRGAAPRAAPAALPAAAPTSNPARRRRRRRR